MIDIPPNSGAKILRFTTRGLIPDYRVEQWEAHNARALIPLDIRTIDGRPLHSEETNLHLPSMRLARVYGTSQIVERSEKFINDNPTGVMAIFFATEGDSFFFDRGGHTSLKPGQALLYDADQPFLRGFNHGFRENVLTISKERFREIVPRSGVKLPMVFEFGPEGSPAEQALGRLVKTTLHRLQLTHVASTDIPLAGGEDKVISLLGAILGSSPNSEASLSTLARSYIDLHLTNRHLSPQEVAAAVGVSERHLARIFSDEGTTVGRHILNRRLHFAHEALTSGQQDAVPVSEIGFRCGFTSPSHFGRTYRERFGMTPLQSRKEAQRKTDPA